MGKVSNVGNEPDAIAKFCVCVNMGLKLLLREAHMVSISFWSESTYRCLVKIQRLMINGAAENTQPDVWMASGAVGSLLLCPGENIPNSSNTALLGNQDTQRKAFSLENTSS